MNPRRNQLLHDAIVLLNAHGATDIQYQQRRHIRLNASYLGQPVTLTISVSPSCRYAGAKNLAWLKRQLRAAERAEKSHG